jgi:hypothetical protein
MREIRNACRILDRTPAEKTPSGALKRKLEENLTIDLRNAGCEARLAEDYVQR